MVDALFVEFWHDLQVTPAGLNLKKQKPSRDLAYDCLVKSYVYPLEK